MSNDDLSPLARMAGPAGIVAGVLLTGSQLVLWTLDRTDRVATLNSITYKLSMAGYVIGFFALMVALVAVYERQARQAGTFGLVALCIAIAGTMDMAGNMWFDAFAAPWIADVMPQTLTAPKRGTLVIAALSSYLLLPLGWLLFGIASFRGWRLSTDSERCDHDRSGNQLWSRIAALRHSPCTRSCRRRHLVSGPLRTPLRRSYRASCRSAVS
jgi:hypothetical protein